MGLDVKTTCSITFAPAETSYTDVGTKKNPKTVKKVRTEGFISVGETGLTLVGPHDSGPAYGGPGFFQVEPRDIDNLISALIEARAIGRHLYGHKGGK